MRKRKPKRKAKRTGVVLREADWQRYVTLSRNSAHEIFCMVGEQEPQAKKARRTKRDKA